MEKTIFCERLADLLKQNNYSQREFAEAIGVTEVSMSRYLKGDRMPKGPIVANMARVLHTTSDYLLGQESDEQDPELAYYQTQRAIARNAGKWSAKQKADLVNALFEV